MKKLVVLSGAGISAESGLGTFRDKGGLWDEFPIEEVATIEAWMKNPKLVLDFYNMRRAAVLQAEPNEAHYALARMEDFFDITIITQNIDDLHERAGSSKVIHLHGDIRMGKSSNGNYEKEALIELTKDKIEFGDLALDGTQLRPHVVWFGEPVPNMPIAEEIVADSELLLIVGTSLNVYPAANLLFHAPKNGLKYLVDKHDVNLPKNIQINKRTGDASVVVPELLNELKEIVA